MAPRASVTALQRHIRKRPWALALAGYVVLGLLLLAPTIRPGHTLMPADILRAVPPYNQVLTHGPHNHAPSDAPLQFYPWMRFLRASLLHGDFPQWNPTVLGGVPTTPNGMVSSPYYPPMLALRWLDTSDVYNLFVLVHLVIGAIGVYAFARVLGSRPMPAWVAGILAMVAGMWVHWSLHLLHLIAMVFLPLALACVHQAVVRPGPRQAAALGAVVGMWWLGGNPQFVYYGTLTVAAYGLALFVLHRRLGLLRPIASVAGGALLGVMLAAPVLLPSLKLGPEILRQRESADALAASHLPPLDLVQLLLPTYRGDPV
ncbi:MAG: hypothetical protein QOJ09_2477, partial [Actinomycetota bacterium]|nr:hypothetical protein [Actinomycetota bacterium]